MITSDCVRSLKPWSSSRNPSNTDLCCCRRLASRACLAPGRNDGPLPDLRIREHVPVHVRKVSRRGLMAREGS